MSERERLNSTAMVSKLRYLTAHGRFEELADGLVEAAEHIERESTEAAERERALVAEVERLQKRDVSLLLSNEGELCDMSISWMARNGYETPELQTVARALAQHESKEASA